jgi:outer membrane protein assembly factor BamB
MGRFVCIALFVALADCLHADDWPQFRGPGGLGVAGTRVPTTWDGKTGIAWKCALPGPGSSSPVTFGKHVYVTCYSGYGLTKEAPGDFANLKRHLVCVRLADGGIDWTATLPKRENDADFTSYVTTHGYASSTPVVDSTGVYVYYGVAGLVAYNHKGEQRWVASCGKSYMNFGSAASPILYRDLVIINADVESGAIVAVNQSDGKEVWRYGPDREPNTWCTPLLLRLAGGDELVSYGKRNELIGLEPATGKLLWTCTIPMESYQCPSPAAHAGVVYAIGDHPGNTVAVRAGGRGDVTGTHRLWNLRKGSVVSSPVYHDGHLYWVKEEGGRAFCVDAATGQLVYEQRLEPEPGRIYASALLADGKIYYVSQLKGTYVVEAKPTFKLLARNLIETDDSIFNGSPAVSNGRLILRSNRFLYCIGDGAK